MRVAVSVPNDVLVDIHAEARARGDRQEAVLRAQLLLMLAVGEEVGSHIVVDA